MTNLTCGEFFRKLRTDNQLTRDEVADDLQVSVSTIARLELNDKLPSVRILLKMSEKFGVSVDELAGGAFTDKGDALADASMKPASSTAAQNTKAGAA